MSNGHYHDTFCSDSIHNTKRELSDWTLAMKVIHGCESLWMGGNRRGSRVHCTRKTHGGLLAPLGVPVKRIVEIATCARQKING